MNLWIPFAAAAGGLLAVAAVTGSDWDIPPVETEQIGYRGTGMYKHRDVEDSEALRALNAVPVYEEASYGYEPDPEGDRAGDIYENVQVLGDLSDDQFNHFMAAITEWVSPEEGCAYCHNEENLALDDVYTKVVARRMIQMTQAINADWTDHVQGTGVTCYTCHRGQPVPELAWSRDISHAPASMAYRAGQNVVGAFTGSTSLPQNALEAFLVEDTPIRVHSKTALPTGENTMTTKEAEWSWSLMMHMSEALGANCVTCHNSRAFDSWDQSPPQRVTAWHGIRMTREINNDYILPLHPVIPEDKLGKDGDVLKVNCATCHQGVQKPFYGESMMEYFGDSLGTKGDTGVPDYESYQPGETEILAPAQSSSVNPVEEKPTQLASGG